MLGATGFIGSWVTRALVAAGADVTAITRPASDTWRLDGLPGVTLVRAGDVPGAIRDLAPESLVCLDWSGVSANERDDEAVQNENVSRQAAVVDAALSSGTQCVIGAGSQAEFGAVDGVIGEDRQPAPTTAYGRAKVAASAALAEAAAASGTRWVWARVFSVFGPLETGPWLLPSLSRAATAGEPFRTTSGTQPWSYLYAADAGRAFAELALNPTAGGTFNLAHPVARPLRESINTFASALPEHPVVEFGEAPGHGLEANVTRLEELGWTPTTELDAALATTARWLRGQSVPDPLVPGMTLPTAPKG